MTRNLQRKPGRPLSGNVSVMVRLPPKVLKRLDQLAKAAMMTRGQYVAKLVMTKAER
jgi:predicted transcriptional regulator